MTAMTQDTYDSFSEDYDRFVNWHDRLAAEMPFVDAVLQAFQDHGRSGARVLDAACGTGMHAIALAQRGHLAAGADSSPGMIGKAAANASPAGVSIRFETCGFGSLAGCFKGDSLMPFDLLLCLGNSLPHLLSKDAIRAALADFSACLRPGGMLLIQNRNFDAVLEKRERWIEPQSHRENGGEWLFLRFYDFDPDGLITFNIIMLMRSPNGDWRQEVAVTRLFPLKQAMFKELLLEAGFEHIEYYGQMKPVPFNPQTSGNLVVVAKKK